MSYCRWSSDDWSSDVYVYEDVSGGWTTHVAGRRHVLPDLPPRVDLPHPFTEAQFSAWWERQELVSELVRRSASDASSVYTSASSSRTHPGRRRDVAGAHGVVPMSADPTPGECADRTGLVTC